MPMQACRRVRDLDPPCLALRANHFPQIVMNLWCQNSVRDVGDLEPIWLERWKSGSIENKEKIENWKDRRDFSFPHLCLAGGVKK